MLISTASSTLVTMRSEHYYLPTVETAYSVGISSLGLYLYPRSATRLYRLVLSHLLSGLATALPITSIIRPFKQMSTPLCKYILSLISIGFAGNHNT